MKKVNWNDHLLNFLAVIIGVTLAFVVSNYAEQEKIDREFEQSIQAMYEEVDSDVQTFEDYQIPDNLQKLELMQKAVVALEAGQSEDSLFYYIQAYFSINNYSPTNITLNSLVTSGKLDLISDFELKSQLLEYRNLSTELVKQGEFQVDYMMNKLLPWFIEHPEIMTEQMSILELDSYAQNQAMLLMSLYTSFVAGKVEKYQLALDRAKEVRTLLEKYQKQN